MRYSSAGCNDADKISVESIVYGECDSEDFFDASLSVKVTWATDVCAGKFFSEEKKFFYQMRFIFKNISFFSFIRIYKNSVAFFFLSFLVCQQKNFFL